MAKLKWGIIGAGTIAQTFARGVAASASGEIVAVGSRTAEGAQAFVAEFRIPTPHSSYQAVLDDPEVEAVYIATVHPAHARLVVQAARAGKHVLCEKPLGVNHAEAMAAVEAAREHDVFLMEGYMYRCHPFTRRLVELVAEGAIGEVRLIEATFSFHAEVGTDHRLRSQATAGGGILDVGGYPVSMARLIAGAGMGKPFAEPVSVVAAGTLDPETGVDAWTSALLGFERGIIARLTTGIALTTENVVRVFGSEGSITVPEPWTLRGSSRSTTFAVQRHGEEPRQVTVEADADPWTIEADTVAVHVAARQAPTMNWADSLGNVRTTDRWRQAIGLTYEAERPTAPRPPMRGGQLTRRDDAAMPYGTIEGIETPVSRLVLGVDNQTTFPHAAVMFDDFFERGGTAFDTAWVYGVGVCETMFGHWLSQRGVRDRVVILGKGAHTPFCTPDGVRSQLAQSLERLQTDHLDIYMLHRDNPDVPVGEFISVLNELRDAGRMRVFGASNWPVERVKEANAWAAANGKRGFAAISNNFSLARMIEPPWAGCRSASDPETRAWLTESQTPLMPWSSQARGFFTGRAKPDDHSDPELVRCWYADDNFERLARVERFAAEREVPTVAVALAWVLHQPFPTFPLIGPRTLEETRTSMEALAIELSDADAAWLNLEGER